MPERMLIRLIVCIAAILLIAIARGIVSAMERAKKEAEADGFVPNPLLGPLGMYIAAYFYNRKKCPTCSRKIKRSTELCPHCGFPVTSA